MTNETVELVLLNDDVTPFEFAVEALVSIFGKTEDDADMIASRVHDNGCAVIGRYSLEIAHQKKAELIKAAKDAGYPLCVVVERL